MYCHYLQQKLEGLHYYPYPGNLGHLIYNNFSKEAWLKWLTMQTKIINENNLNMLNNENRKFIKNLMINFFFIEYM